MEVDFISTGTIQKGLCLGPVQVVSTWRLFHQVSPVLAYLRGDLLPSMLALQMFSGKAFISLRELKFYPGLESASVLVLDGGKRVQFLQEMCFVV